MNWLQLTSEAQLEELKKDSSTQPILIFKHSTRCSISSSTLNRLERNWNAEEMKNVKAYYLDLISFRSVSNAIEQLLGVEHQSPQAILVKNGKASWNASHYDISYEEIKSALK